MSQKRVIQPNSFAAWMLAVRPKVLTASIMPVIIACALAYNDGAFQWIPSICCFVFACLAQIASNFANDYYDYVKGTDREDRLGPDKACYYIAPRRVLIATLGILALAASVGSVLILYGGWEMIIVGILVGICALAYSTGPFPLSYLGLGDIFVVLFYGIVPVGFTYYLQAGYWTLPATLLGLAIGLVVNNIMVSNNYRDYKEDIISNKKTIIVRFGRGFGRFVYLFSVVGSLLLCQGMWFYGELGAAMLPLLTLPAFIQAYHGLCTKEGEALNEVLFQSARNVMIFGLLVTIGLIFI